MQDHNNLASEIQGNVIDEAFRAMGFSKNGLVRKIFGPLMSPAARRFANFAVQYDQMLQNQPASTVSKELIANFANEVTICGARNVPEQGPLLLASNHPGVLDGFAIISALPRDDLKLIISGVPLVESLEYARRYLIYTPYNAQERINVVRQAIRHLEQGGTLMIFPSGKLDPDPAFLPGAQEALADWSSSLEIFLRKVPQTKVVVTIASGVLSPSVMGNPLTKLRSEFWQRQRIAEYIQVIQMMFFAKKFDLYPKISFAEPASTVELLKEGEGHGMMWAMINRAQHLLATHTATAGC